MVRNLEHIAVHFLCSVLLGLSVFLIDKSSPSVIPLAILGGLIPDLDHLLYYFIYGRKTDYSIKVKGYLKNRQFSKLVIFCNQNHKKELDELFFHSIWFIAFLVFLTFRFSKRIYLATFIASMALHLCFDIADDLRVLGKLNKNWRWPFGQEG